MGSRIIAVGLPGVGKTTVLNELEKQAGRRGLPLKVVNYGTVMVEMAEKEKASMHRDDMRKSSLAFQHKLQKMAAEEILRRSSSMENGVLVVDTHMMVKTPSGYLPGVPSHIISILQPSLIVLIEASPEEIKARRMRDSSGRMRDKAVAEEVEFEIHLSRTLASGCSLLSGAPLGIVENPPGEAAKAAEKILNMIEALGG
ncbi:adenylate kinase [Candidatus Hecatella orcuttiae]|uniref:adenylate kinase n=1 Tax=Candidatus Hecatella orcuttiae TaxID=1935119 RepID=UPI002867D7B5|nr:adenylate kinase [Candidatus Hecatella orcuttiae]